MVDHPPPPGDRSGPERGSTRRQGATRGQGATREEGDDLLEDQPARLLDDRRHRRELRQRYYGLLQELRVLLPGVQVLVAFFLTAPFASDFDRLDQLGRAAYGVALTSGMVAVVALLTPTAFHRVADRTARTARLVWGIRMIVVGLTALALSLSAAFFCVTRTVFGAGVAVPVTLLGIGLVGTLWAAVPLRYRHRGRDDA